MGSGRAIFKKIVSPSVVDDIIGQLVESIISGHLQPGDRIPTEVELMEQLDVGRNSVREAIKVLVSYGILEIRRADGTFVCSGFSPKMLNPLLYGIILENNIGELNELREVLDNGSFQLAIQNANDNDLREIEKIVDHMQQEVLKTEPDIDAYFQMDLEFHRAVARSTHNTLFIKFDDVMALLLTQIRLKNIQAYFVRGSGQMLVDLHAKTFQIIRDRDIEGIPYIIRENVKPADQAIRDKELQLNDLI